MMFSKKSKVSTMVQRYTAFTLAEVLITLGIIGVVAALTIPTLVKNYQEQLYKTAYKKAYSVAGQAFLSIDANNFINMSNETSPGNPIYFQLFMANFKIIKQCTNGSNNFECWDNTGELFGKDFSSGYPADWDYAFIDSSGMAWTIINGSSIGRIAVDTNGFKQPNVYGKDRFIFLFVDSNGANSGSPAKIKPLPDCTDESYAINHNRCSNVCPGNQCGTLGSPMYRKYYGTSWLYN